MKININIGDNNNINESIIGNNNQKKKRINQKEDL